MGSLGKIPILRTLGEGVAVVDPDYELINFDGDECAKEEGTRTLSISNFCFCLFHCKCMLVLNCIFILF